jgi:hypothetical protein
MTNWNGDHRMNHVLRIATIAVAFVIGAAAVASANTMELTLTVPLKITLPADAKGSPAVINGVNGQVTLRAFDVNCAVGSNLGYATGVGAQGQIVGTGGTATSGTKTVMNPNGSISASPQATVIITYDDGVNGAAGSGAGAKAVPSYLCWVQWQTAIPSLAPIFVQGNLLTH